jgi:hypothetical protein
MEGEDKQDNAGKAGVAMQVRGQDRESRLDMHGKSGRQSKAGRGRQSSRAKQAGRARQEVQGNAGRQGGESQTRQGRTVHFRQEGQVMSGKQSRPCQAGR